MTPGIPADPMRAMLEARSTLLEDLADVDGVERLLLRSDLSGTMQVHERSSEHGGGGERQLQLTRLPEPVAEARYVPGRRQAVLGIDEGGNERHQLYLLDLEPASQAPVEDFHRLQALTGDARFGHHLAGVSPDGRLVAYLSNRGNGVDFDLWLCELESGEHRCLHAAGAWLQPGSGFSPDGRLVSVLRPGPRPLDADLVLVDVESGAARTVLEHPGEAAVVGAPVWVNDGGFYAPSNVGRDFAAVVRHELASGESTVIADTGERFDAEVLAAAGDETVLLAENRDGATALRLYDHRTGGAGQELALPEPGVVFAPRLADWPVGPPAFSADGARVYYTLSTPRIPGDVFVLELASGTSRRLTSSPCELDPQRLVSAEATRIESFDGEQVPLFIFRPPAAATPGPPPPVVVFVHGGPESQSDLSFRAVIQGLALSGYGVVVPNVRGSTGYGKRYASLDDTTRRLDSVRDLAAVHGALDSFGFDPARAALWGGSYGGYMVLAGLAFQPELWAAGVDIVGISDLVSFLENTSDYRRAHREREYGSLATDREFLASASPLRHADAIRAPLFVIHGRNDPRVPLSETEQLAAGLARRGVRCDLNVYDDEGHGLARLVNRLDAYPRAVAFLDEVLGR